MFNNSTSDQRNGTFRSMIPDLVGYGLGIVMLSICVFGFIGNVLSIIIFLSPRMRSPINIILTGLCIIDIAVVLTAIPLFSFPAIYAYIRVQRMQVIITYSIKYLYAYSMTARTSSVWLLVLITFERFLAICYPWKVNRISNNVTHAKVAVVVTTLSAFAYNFVRFWEFQLVSSEKHAGMIIPQKMLRANQQYILWYMTIVFLPSHFIVPFFLLLIFNGYIIRTIQQMRKQRQRLSSQQQQEHKTTYMMVTLILLFLLTNTLPYVLNILEIARRNYFTKNTSTIITMVIITDISNLLVVTNSSTNSCIYFIFSRRYRTYLVSYLQCKSPAKHSNELTEGVSMLSKHALQVVGYHSLQQRCKMRRASYGRPMLRTQRSDACLLDKKRNSRRGNGEKQKLKATRSAVYRSGNSSSPVPATRKKSNKLKMTSPGEARKYPSIRIKGWNSKRRNKAARSFRNHSNQATTDEPAQTLYRSTSSCEHKKHQPDSRSNLRLCVKPLADDPSSDGLNWSMNQLNTSSLASSPMTLGSTMQSLTATIDASGRGQLHLPQNNNNHKTSTYADPCEIDRLSQAGSITNKNSLCVERCYIQDKPKQDSPMDPTRRDSDKCSDDVHEPEFPISVTVL